LIISGKRIDRSDTPEGWVKFDGPIIVASGIGDPPAPADETCHWISPGLVDLQVNGGAGVEVTQGAGALQHLESALIASGTTSYLATIISTSEAVAEAAMTGMEPYIRSPNSPLVGIHLEGPFLNPERAGVHVVKNLLVPLLGIPSYVRSPHVRLVTIAPELPGSLDLITELSDSGVVVSIGHSNADPATAGLGVAAGASMVTHLFNGMPPFHHRDPGLVGWALGEATCTLGLIADGHHVSPIALALTCRAAEGRVILVSDQSVGALSPSGIYRQGGISVERREDGTVTTIDGGLAGSGSTLAENVKTWVESTGATFPEAVRSATYRPAMMLGQPCGLEPGSNADIVLWNAEMDVDSVIFRGDLIST